MNWVFFNFESNIIVSFYINKVFSNMFKFNGIFMFYKIFFFVFFLYKIYLSKYNLIIYKCLLMIVFGMLNLVISKGIYE